MDMQLYKVDKENYLVDFRNIGYYQVDADGRRIGRDVPFQSGGAGEGEGAIGGVSGPFHFLEMACQLISELASG